MAVFLVVIAIAGDTFNNIVSLVSKYSKSEETNIEGIVGLEIIRHDLEQMGFGLPWKFLSGSAINYAESVDADASTNDHDKTGRLDSNENKIPRALVALNNSSSFASDMLGVKATTVGRSIVSQRYTYIPFHNVSTSTGRISRPVVWPAGNLQDNNKVIAIRSNFNNSDDDHILLDKSGDFAFDFKAADAIDEDYLPQNDQETNFIYGVDQSTLRMPFNRADFFIKVPDASTKGKLPAFCEQSGTGVLYKAWVNHSDGKYTYIPLLDCVADMQVVLGWDTSEGGRANNVDAYSSLPDSAGSVTVSPSTAKSGIEKWLKSPKDLRGHLKIIKVYILAQEGRRERNYTFPQSSIIVGKDCNNAETSDIDCGSSFTKNYTFTAEQRHYKWKVYRIIAHPRNLASN